MPTEKRQRQREGRQARQQYIAASRRRSRNMRRGIVLGVVVVLVGVLAAVFGFSGSNKSTSVKSGNSTTTTTKAPTAVAPVCPKPDGTSPKEGKFTGPPPMCIDPTKHYTATVTTDVGTFTIALDAAKAPKTVNNFVFLARYHFYDGVTFHRVIPGFVVQGGDPTGTGSGGPGYKFADELPAAGSYKVGSVAMANSGANTNGSQFFIVTGPEGTSLPPKYSLFGQVATGLDVVKKIEADGSTDGTPKVTHKMLKVTIAEQ